MNFQKKISRALITLLLVVAPLSGCKEKEFDPPNKKEVLSGSVEISLPVGTATKLRKYADTMAKVWDQDSVLMEINGINLGVDGYNRANYNSSQWVYSYFSPKKPPMQNGYTVTFNGKGMTTWLQNSASGALKDNISNFAVDSDKALLAATKAGLPEGRIYTIELAKNAKGMLWIIGSKFDENATKYDIKKIDAVTGEVKE